MEQTQRKSRKANRSIDERRTIIEQKIAYHEIHANQLRKSLADLNTPKERKPRALSLNKVMATAKTDGVTPEEIMEFLRTRKEAASI